MIFGVFEKELHYSLDSNGNRDWSNFQHDLKKTISCLETQLADAKKGIAMFGQAQINVPIIGLVENMAYFTPAELPNNKYYLFGKDGGKNLAEEYEIPFLGQIPLVQSIREAGDYGRPAAMQTGTVLEAAFEKVTRNVVQQVVNRNESIPPTEAIKITTMAGCSAVNKK